LAEGWDAVISVASPRDLQWKRLMERGLTEIEAKQRLAAQLPQAEKMNRADWVIFNSGTKEMLKDQVKAVLRRIVES
jgi:dephospho-CoA kinase